MLQKAFWLLLAGVLVSAPALAAEIPAQATLAMDAGLAAVDAAASPDDLGKAAEHFARAASVAPDWPEAHYNLGKVLALMPDRSAEAVKALQRFLALSPQAPEAEAVKAEIAQVEKRAALLQKQGSILKELKLAQLKDGIYVVEVTGPGIRFQRRAHMLNGLTRGDKIETVNGRSTNGMSLDELYAIIEDGPPQGNVCFLRNRGGKEPLELSIKREDLYKGSESFRMFKTPCAK